MVTMLKNYDDHNAVIKLQKDNEAYCRDQRRQAKEAIDFTTKRDGQWEPEIIEKFSGRPRYTDDRINPIINQMVGELYQAEFTGRVRPAGGDSTKETAQLYDGLIRTIRNNSKFKRIINQTGRRVATAGFGAWEIVKEYMSPNSFHQDLLIKCIEDAHERVLIDPDSMSPTGENAKWAIIKHYISKAAFVDKFGDKAKMASIGTDNWSDSYYNKPENLTVGQLYYLEPFQKDIVLMSDGSVYEDNDDFMQVVDDLAMQEIVEIDRRTTTSYKCFQRWYSAAEWLTEPEEVGFDFIPVVPVYGNFEVTEGKIIFFGAVERLMDIQRVHNYAFSRNVEEVALSPRSKWFMTPEQAAGYTKSLKSLNTNMNPVQFYNHVPDQPPPFWSNTSAPNQAVLNLQQLTDEGINKAAGIFAANIGDNPNVQSGIAIQEQIDRGNNGTAWLFEALEQSIERTCQLLVRAIPSVYDGTREVILTGDDNSLESTIINEPVFDSQTQQVIYLQDLTQGEYDVTIDIGAAYKNRQAEAVESFERLAQQDPILLEIGRDIHLNNIEAPNMDLVAERARIMMINNGSIPDEQLTEEELARVQQMRKQQENQPQQPDPAVIQLQIAETQANTAMLAEQNEQARNQIKMMELQNKYQADAQKTEVDIAYKSAQIDQGQQKIDLQAQKQQIDSAMQAMKAQADEQRQQFEQMMQMQKAQQEQMLALADVLSKLKVATGADAIIEPNAVQAFSNTAERLNDDVSN